MHKKIVLNNGLTIITAPMKNTRSVTVLILVGAGTKYEEKKENGISHFLEHMYFKGTKKRKNALSISKEIDGVGGIMNAFTSKDFTGYFVKADYSHFKLAIDVVSDIFLNSTLPKEEIEKEKGVIIEEIKMYEDSPMDYIETVWEKLLYGDQPAGWNIAGEREIILNIKREQFLKYIKNFYTTQNTIVSVAGNIKEKEAIPLIKDYFSKAKSKKARQKKPVKEAQRSPQKLILNKDTQQTHFALGVRAFNVLDKKKYPLKVLSVILGGNMSSRLFQEIREKRGLAYYVRTVTETNPDTGYLVTYSGVDSKNIQQSVSVILQEYKKIANKGPNDKELKLAKEYLKGTFRLSLEESDNVASYYGLQALLENKLITPEQKIKLIEKVSKRDIIETARLIFINKKLNFAAITKEKIKIGKFEL